MHDTVRAVLRDPAFRRSVRRTLLERIMLWLGEAFERLMRALGHLPPMRNIGLGIVALVVVFVLVRTLIAVRADGPGSRRLVQRRGATVHANPWEDADHLASEGRYDDAAHALYRAVLLTLAQTHRITLDASRTSGDYARELRRRGSPAAPIFRAFTKRFDSVVYGHEGGSAEVFAELRALSEPFHPRTRAA